MISETPDFDRQVCIQNSAAPSVREATVRATKRFRGLRLSTAGLLLATLLLALVIAASPPASAQGSNSPCTGDVNADYNGTCGPSLTIPSWSDAAGWDSPALAETITLFDLDGDGTDELIGRCRHGLLVNTWSDDDGQWVPASELSVPLPFPGPDTADNLLAALTLRFGQLADGVWGVVALTGNGLETWSWDPGDGSSPNAGVWTLESSDGPFKQFFDQDAAGYWSTIQFVPEPLGGSSYGVIGRTSDGIQFCAWDHTGKDWTCKTSSGVFSDEVMLEIPTRTTLAPYYYDTIQFGDVYAGRPGPELLGRNNEGGGVLKVYFWDSSSQTFTELEPSGPWPFWSPEGVAWDAVRYSSTIQPVQLEGEGQPVQMIGRSADGLRWFGIRDSGCGKYASPCWQHLTTPQNTPLSDADGYHLPQFYETIRFIDLDSDGIDELLARYTGSGADGSNVAPGTIVMWSFEAGTDLLPV